MQTLDVISVNIWQILISLANLYILFLIVKKFLYEPVKNVLAKRQAELDERYAAAENAAKQAESDRETWHSKLENASAEADNILKNAVSTADRRSEKIISDAKEKAESIVRTAKTEAELEKQKASDGIKREIVEVSEALAEKMLAREINAKDHQNLIDSVISEIGGGND